MLLLDEYYQLSFETVIIARSVLLLLARFRATVYVEENLTFFISMKVWMKLNFTADKSKQNKT
jgi:hypothetical protein